MIRRLRPLLSLLLAAAVAGAPAMALASAAPTATESVAMEVTGAISAASPTVLESDSTLRLTTTLDADDAAELAGARVHLRLTTEDLASHEDIEEFLASPESFARTTVAERTIVGPMAGGTGSGSSVTFAVSAEDLALPQNDAGVYGLTVTVVSDEGAVTVDSMVITWAPVDLPALEVATVATVTGSESRAAAIVAASDLDGVSLLVDPTLGNAGTTSQHELYRIPAGNADLTSLARADGAPLIDFAVGSANSNASVLLRTRDIVAPVAVADEETLTAAADAGIDTVILEPRFEGGDVVGAGDAAVAYVQTESGSVTVIRPEETLSAALSTAGTEAQDAARLVAEAAVATLGSDGGVVVVSPGQSWSVSGEGTSEALEALLEAPFVEPVSLSTALDDAEVAEAEPSSSSVGTDADLDAATVAELSQALEEVEVIASAATQKGELLEQYALDLVHAVSLPSRAGLGTRAALVSGALSTAEEATSGISVATSADINFIAAEGGLPVTVRNTTSQELTVVVSAFSDAPELRITGTPSVTVGAGAEAVVQIPVTAVSSANVDVTVAIETRDGEVISEPQTLRVRVRADWGNAATVIFSVMLTLLLIAGVIRTIRRGRRDTRLGPSALGTDASDQASHGDDAPVAGDAEDADSSEAGDDASAGEESASPGDEADSSPRTRDNT